MLMMGLYCTVVMCFCNCSLFINILDFHLGIERQLVWAIKTNIEAKKGKRKNILLYTNEFIHEFNLNISHSATHFSHCVVANIKPYWIKARCWWHFICALLLPMSLVYGNKYIAQKDCRQGRFKDSKKPLCHLCVECCGILNIQQSLWREWTKEMSLNEKWCELKRASCC